MEQPRLTDQERQDLFHAALETEHGQTLKRHLWSGAVLIERDRDWHRSIGEGVADSPDGGYAMAKAQWEDLSEDERRMVSKDVGEVLRRTLAESVFQLEDASGRLRVDPHEIHPVTVALLAASTLMLTDHRYEEPPWGRGDPPRFSASR